jgi:hypothetical protein
MYKLQIENNLTGSLTERTFLEFSKCFEVFQIELRIRDIQKFDGFGIPRDEDIEEVGFGLMFHANGRFTNISILKTATGNELKIKNPFLKNYNGQFEALVNFMLNNGGREFLSFNVQFENSDAGLVKFFESSNQVVGIVERKQQFEVVFSQHFETFGEAISAIETHFKSDDFSKEKVEHQNNFERTVYLTALVTLSILSTIFLIKFFF